MHGTQRRIAVLNRVDDDTYAHQIINVGEIVPAHDHLLVNGEVVLRTARHIGFDVLFVEILIDFGENLLQVHVALSGATGHQYHNLVVDLRIQNLEAEFFQLGLMAFMPRRLASGAYTSSVSRAFFCAFDCLT